MGAYFDGSIAMLLTLSGDFISTYVVDLKTEHYIEYKATRDYKKLGLAKEGDHFFERTRKDAEAVIFSDDLFAFKEVFTKENILQQIEQKGVFMVHYRLLINGAAKPATTRITKVNENNEDKLIVGIRL